MKKLFSILLVAVMMCSMLSMTVFAANENVVSPEHDNTDVDSDPVSPQTGYALPIAGVAVIALTCGAVAVISTKKAHE